MNVPLRSALIELDGNLDDAFDYFDVHALGDGLPIVPPTPERVVRVLEYLADHCGLAPDNVVAVLPPSQGIATVEKVAINAVVAGCRPEHTPYVVAALRAVAEPGFNARSIQVTSNPATVMLILNGPDRVPVGINSLANCMGQGARANVTIGRAVRLLMVNVGGGAPGTVDKACHGFPGKIAFCFGEAEEESPWLPLHVERGFAVTESVVTVAAAQGTSNILTHGRPNAADLLPALAYGMVNPGANNFTQGAGQPHLVLNPSHARALAADGISKSELRAYLFDNARVPLDWYTEREREVSRMADRAIGGMLPITDDAANIVITVAGIPGSHSTFIPTFADSRTVSAPLPSAAR